MSITDFSAKENSISHFVILYRGEELGLDAVHDSMLTVNGKWENVFCKMQSKEAVENNVLYSVFFLVPGENGWWGSVRSWQKYNCWCKLNILLNLLGESIDMRTPHNLRGVILEQSFESTVIPSSHGSLHNASTSLQVSSGKAHKPCFYRFENGRERISDHGRLIEIIAGALQVAKRTFWDMAVLNITISSPSIPRSFIASPFNACDADVNSTYRVKVFSAAIALASTTTARVVRWCAEVGKKSC